jgi:hypothetical protein
MTTGEAPKNPKEHAERLNLLLTRLFDDTSLESTALASKEIFLLMEATFKWLENPDSNANIKELIDKLPDDLRAKLNSAETKIVARTSLEALADLSNLKCELEQTPFAPAFDLTIVRMLFLSQMFFGLNPGIMRLNLLAARGEKAQGASSKGGKKRANSLNWWHKPAEALFEGDPLSLNLSGEELGRRYGEKIFEADEFKRRPNSRSLAVYILKLQREKRAAE